MPKKNKKGEWVYEYWELTPKNRKAEFNRRYKAMETHIPKLIEIAQIYREDPYNLLAHFMQESKGNPKAISTDKDQGVNYGLGQLRMNTVPDVYTHNRELFAKHNVPQVTNFNQLYDPVINAHYTLGNRKRLRERYKLEDYEQMLGGYRGGHASKLTKADPNKLRLSDYSRNIREFESDMRNYYPDLVPKPVAIAKAGYIKSSISDALNGLMSSMKADNTKILRMDINDKLNKLPTLKGE